MIKNKLHLCKIVNVLYLWYSCYLAMGIYGRFLSVITNTKGKYPRNCFMTTDLLDSILLCYTVLLQSLW